MKELRLRSPGCLACRIAFDGRREAILLAAADKAGVPEARFYRQLIRRADRRFSTHMSHLRM
jgi:hypothetical protein